MEINSDNNSFITLKDHEENVKIHLDTASKIIREAMDLNQWRNSETVTDWSKSITTNTCTSLSYLILKNVSLLLPKTC